MDADIRRGGMNSPGIATWVIGERGGRQIGRYEALFESPEEFEALCERLRVDLELETLPEALLYDLQADPTLRLTVPTAETCSRTGCSSPTRYVLVHKGVSYPICETCIEDFEFWQTGNFDGPEPR